MRLDNLSIALENRDDTLQTMGEKKKYSVVYDENKNKKYRMISEHDSRSFANCDQAINLSAREELHSQFEIH